MLKYHNAQLPRNTIATTTNPRFAGAVVDPATDYMLELPALLKGSKGQEWNIANTKKGKLAQGVGTIIPHSSNTIFFIPHHSKSKHKKSTYVRIVCTSQKTEIKRVCWIVDGDQIDYKGNLHTPTANLITVKCHINSTIFTPGAKYCTMNIKNFYLGTPMTLSEYL